MPFRSLAQKRKFAELVKQGKMTPEKFSEWEKETAGKKLPERVVPRPKNKVVRKVKTI